MKKSLEAINIVNLDHLGIVAGIIDEMELVEEVNKKVGLKNKETVSPGQVMKAIILNGLGFLSAPVYLFETFFVGKAIEYREKQGKNPKGKPKISSQTQTKVYEVTGEIETRTGVIEAEKISSGRFILATNILDAKIVSNEQILSEYKAQQSNERGFRFIKDPLFFTSSVFVKKPERVEAIGMIMGLCLLVYNLAQRKLRQQLEATNQGVKNQVKKLTNKPTMRWIFQMFQAVHLVTINGEKQISNLNQDRQNVLKHLGEYCCQYYLMLSSG